MSSNFFTVLIDNKPTSLEKKRVIAIESYNLGTRITIEASHEEEEPIIYFTSVSYEDVMRSYLL